MSTEGIAPFKDQTIAALQELAKSSAITDKTQKRLLASMVKSRIAQLNNPNTAKNLAKRRAVGSFGIGKMPIPEKAIDIINDRIKKAAKGSQRWKNYKDLSANNFMLTVRRKSGVRKPAPFTMESLRASGLFDDDAYQSLPTNKRMAYLWKVFYATSEGQQKLLDKADKLGKMATAATALMGSSKVLNGAKVKP